VVVIVLPHREGAKPGEIALLRGVEKRWRTVERRCLSAASDSANKSSCPPTGAALTLTSPPAGWCTGARWATRSGDRSTFLGCKNPQARHMPLRR
jgi:hypothetical protein